MKYSYHPTRDFATKLEKISVYDPTGHRRIQMVIERLLDNPGDADGWMHGVHHGRLKKYVGRKDYRLIYHWCEQCRKQAEKLAHCGACGEVTDHSVVFYDIYHKNEQDAHLRNRG